MCWMCPRSAFFHHLSPFLLGGSSSMSLMPRTQTLVSQRASASFLRNRLSSRAEVRRLRQGFCRSLSTHAKKAFLSVH
uniref:Secreted protein n=1 Tax=Ixodes ricinus TaxID=34613 RepID=A0A6B0U556_IXORI